MKKGMFWGGLFVLAAGALLMGGSIANVWTLGVDGWMLSIGSIVGGGLLLLASFDRHACETSDSSN